jgi:hypothetical protein
MLITFILSAAVHELVMAIVTQKIRLVFTPTYFVRSVIDEGNLECICSSFRRVNGMNMIDWLAERLRS